MYYLVVAEWPEPTSVYVFGPAVNQELCANSLDWMNFSPATYIVERREGLGELQSKLYHLAGDKARVHIIQLGDTLPPIGGWLPAEAWAWIIERQKPDRAVLGPADGVKAIEEAERILKEGPS